MSSELKLEQFANYRAFLIAHAQWMKQRKSSWSYGAWSRAIGLRTTSSLTKIIQGQREPGPEITEKLIRYFKFGEKQARYFRDLIRLHRIQQDPRLYVLLLEKMGKDFPDATFRLLDDRTFLVISNWYYLALREFCRIPGFRPDPEWIAGQFRFKVTAREINQAIKVLIESGLLNRDPSGRLRIVEGRLDTTNDVASEGIRRYHEQMLGHARSAIREIPIEEREVTSTSLVMSSSKMEMAKQLIREFKQKFEKLMEDASGDQVYQIQVQLFPLTRSMETTRSRKGD